VGLNERQCSKYVSISEDRKSAKSNSNSFGSVLGEYLFLPGKKYYFEFHMKKGDDFYVGVSRVPHHYDDSLGAAGFSGKAWSYYDNSSKFHTSFARYGEKYSEGDTIGVYFDLIQV
jgi:hypothetical protein